MWSQKHWTKRKQLNDEHQMVMRSAIDPDEAFLFKVPVELRFTAYMKGRMTDCSNLCVKPYEDALIGWYIKDDDPKHVRTVSLTVVRDTENPRLVVEIEPYDDNT